MRLPLLVVTLVSAAAPALSVAAVSECYGRVGKGRLENGVQLPLRGNNFTAYSIVAAGAGRTYLHSTAAKSVLDAYARLHAGLPATRYVYGETGLASGGRFAPHRTHQNGLSVDFFVPVRDAAGKSVPLPTEHASRLGYDIEFDASGSYRHYQIDFTAISEHLYQLHAAARSNGAGIDKVIIDPAFLPHLFGTPRGPWLKKYLPFMMGKPWVRHDEHYHVDFSLPCRAM